MARRDVGVIIAAAGSGTRTGSAELKQFRWIAGKPMLLHSLQRFQEREDVAMVVCVLPREYVGDPPPWIFQSDSSRLLISVGGRERTDSVAHGLEDLPPECEIVVVHDAARPFFSSATAEAVIAAARRGECAVPVLTLSDALKRVDANGVIVETLDRDGLARVQTPQAFPRALLERAHTAARAQGIVAPDDAALCEKLGMRCVSVPGTEAGIKITSEDDFAVGEALAILSE